MSALRTDSAIALIAALALALPAAAQEATGAPRTLTAPPSGESAPPPETTGAATRSDGTTVQTLPPPPGWESVEPGAVPADRSVETGALGRVDLDLVGTLDETNGGLGGDLWRASPRAAADRMIGALPDPVASPALRDLAIRALMTRAEAPAGGGSFPFSRTRVEGLMRLGAYADAAALAGDARALADDAPIQRQRAEAAFLSLPLEAACGHAMAGGGAGEGAFWVLTRAVCYVVEGNDAGADLTLALMGEDQTLAGLVPLVAALREGRTPDTAPVRPYDAAGLALLHELKLGVPAEAFAGLGPAALRFVALGPGSEPGLRLAAAMQAARAGLMTGEELRAIFAAQRFSDAELAEASRTVESRSGPVVLALAFQAMEKADANQLKLVLLAGALEAAERDGTYLPVARAFAPLAATITPDDGAAWAAPIIGRALAAAGDAAAAERWYDTFNLNAPSLRSAVAMFQLALALADPAPPRRTAQRDLALNLFADQLSPQTLAPRPVRQQAAFAIALAEAAGLDMPRRAFEMMDRGFEMEDGRAEEGFFGALDTAVDGGRRGEAIFAAIALIGQAGPGRGFPRATVEAVRALKDLGFAAEARALALEALTARPFLAPGA